MVSNSKTLMAVLLYLPYRCMFHVPVKQESHEPISAPRCVQTVLGIRMQQCKACSLQLPWTCVLVATEEARGNRDYTTRISLPYPPGVLKVIYLRYLQESLEPSRPKSTRSSCRSALRGPVRPVHGNKSCIAALRTFLRFLGPTNPRAPSM